MRLRSVAIFGIGYLVGTRAGHERYEQITGRVRELAESDFVRGYVDRASTLARRPLASAGDTIDDTSAEDVSENGADDGDNGDRTERATRSRARRSK